MYLGDELDNVLPQRNANLEYQKERDVFVASGNRLAIEGALVFLGCLYVAVADVLPPAAAWLGVVISAAVTVLGILKANGARRKFQRQVTPTKVEPAF